MLGGDFVGFAHIIDDIKELCGCGGGLAADGDEFGLQRQVVLPGAGAYGLELLSLIIEKADLVVRRGDVVHTFRQLVPQGN